jgi:hypothetical protein
VWTDRVSEAAIEDLATVAEPAMEAVTEPVLEQTEELVVELANGGFGMDGEVAEAEELVAEIKGPGTTEIEVLVNIAQFAVPAVEEPVDEELPAEGRISPPPLAEAVRVLDDSDAGPTELDALVETASVEPAAVEAPAAELLVEMPVEELLVEEEEELPVEEMLVEEVPIEELSLTGAQVAEVEAEAPVATEVALAAETVVEVAAPVLSGDSPSDSVRVDDLKARIETSEETQQPEPDWTVLPVVPAVSAPAEAAPVLDEPAVLSLETEDREVEVVFPEEPQVPIDYDSMKSRIERTRSRLKAKAFDAMMTGESALLGRDAEASDRKRKKLPNVDTEVDETIETSLREEED